MGKMDAAFRQLNALRNGLKPGKQIVYSAKRGFESVATSKVKRLDKNYETSFPQLKKRILHFLQEHRDFDAGLLQRWIEKRAEKLAKKEKSKLHKVQTLFGRGTDNAHTATDLKMLASIIEEHRLGHDSDAIQRFKEIATSIKQDTPLNLDEVMEFLLTMKETYMKEILDLNDLLLKSTTPQAHELHRRLKSVVHLKEKQLLDDLFQGETLRAHKKS